VRDPLHELDQAFDPLALDLFGHLVRHRGGLGAAPGRVDEGEGAVVADLLDDLHRLLEVALGLAREADDDVGRQGQVGDPGTQLVDEPQIALAPVRAPHRLQDPRRAGLQREVRVLADRLAFRHGRDHVPPEVLRMRAREADALDPGHRVTGAEEFGEVGLEVREQIAAPRVDVLTEERELADAVLRQPVNLGQDLAGPAADLPPADLRDDAVGAHGVTAHRHLHPGLEAALAVRGEPGGERALLADPEARPRRLPARAEPLAEVRDRAGPEGDVDERIKLKKALALCLGVAAANRNHLVAVALLERAGLSDVRGEALIRLLADRAGVEDEHVGLVLRNRLAEPELLEHPLDPLRVMGVHLAPEGGDVVTLHGSES
jgi:hypothetical protein